MVLASQCILQPKPKTMRINIEGKLSPGVTAKDIALFIISRMTTGGATGYLWNMQEKQSARSVWKKE